MLEASGPPNVWLESTDLARSRHFYAELLGLPLWREEPGVALHFGIGGGILTLHHTDRPSVPLRATKVLFALGRSIDQVCDELVERGVVLEQPLRDRADGRSAMFRDPDGHEIWVCRPSATETQFQRWRQSERSKRRRIPVNRERLPRRHERPARSRRVAHPRS